MNKPDYRLMKDTLEQEAGAIFNFNEKTSRYESKTENGFFFFRTELVENSPNWFDKVETKEYTERDLIEFGQYIFCLLSAQAANYKMDVFDNLEDWKNNHYNPD